MVATAQYGTDSVRYASERIMEMTNKGPQASNQLFQSQCDPDLENDSKSQEFPEVSGPKRTWQLGWSLVVGDNSGRN